MDIIHTCDAMLAHCGGSFVPTMGALHEGHCALIRRAADLGDPVVVSIFVNPTQFGPEEDLETYPRRIDEDMVMAKANGANVIFAPSVEEMYPPGQNVEPPPLPAVATEPQLEETHRPDHFRGVCQVVARSFDILLPRFAVFGEKDYQQLQVIRMMVEHQRPRWKELEIVSHSTIREPDGLAMSSRNINLKTNERERALGIFRALSAAQAAMSADDGEHIMHDVLSAHELAIDYAVVRDAELLMPVADLRMPCRALIAARLGSVRLIDNLAIAISE